MKIGYIRVSTAKQANEGTSIETQTEQLTMAGCERLYIDKGKSGATVERPELTRMRQELRPGDEVMVSKLDRFGRNLRDTLALIDELTANGVGFVSLSDNIRADSSPTGKLMLNIFASFAEFERDRIKERTAEGIEKAREKGVKFGRPETNYAAQAVKLRRLEERSPDLTVAEKARVMGVSRATYYRIKKAPAAPLSTQQP